MEITVKITGIDGLVEALQRLAPHGACSCAAEPTASVDAPAPAPGPRPKAAANAPQPQPQPPQQPAPELMPTEEVAYTFEALQRAAAHVARSGKRAELQGVLQALGITSLMELQPAQYNTFAAQLRELGGVL